MVRRVLPFVPRDSADRNEAGRMSTSSTGTLLPTIALDAELVLKCKPIVVCYVPVILVRGKKSYLERIDRKWVFK